MSVKRSRLVALDFETAAQYDHIIEIGCVEFLDSKKTGRSYFRAAVIFLALGMLAACGDKSVSGSYIAKFTNAVGLLQLVETPGKHVTGQLQMVVNIDGEVQNNSYSVTGAVDGSNISLSLKPNLLLSESVPESGTFNSSTIMVTGKFASAQPVMTTFVRADAREFQPLVKAINDQAEGVRAAKATAAARQREVQAEAAAREKAAQQERDFVNGLEALVRRMDHFDSAVNSILGKVPAAEQRYHAITAQMRENLRKERSLAGNPNAGVARSQISIAINQGSIATDQLHNEVQPTQWDYENNAVPLMKQAAAAETTCRGLQNGTGDDLASQTDARNAACKQLLDAGGRFKPKFDAFSQNLKHLEEVYQQEHTAQVQLINDATRLE